MSHTETEKWAPASDPNVIATFEEDRKQNPLTERVKFIPPSRVYFAGRIKKNCWRHSIIGRTISSDDVHAEFVPHDLIRFGTDQQFEYTGPYFRACDHGCSHGSATHGAAAGCIEDAAQSRRQVFRAALNGIQRADTIFVWLDRYHGEANATKAEVGYAFALEKNIVLACPDADAELWFLGQMATSIIFAQTAKEAWEKYLSFGAAGDHADLVEQLLLLPEKHFRDHELQFLRGIRHRNLRLTPKQQNWLESISRKILAKPDLL